MCTSVYDDTLWVSEDVLSQELLDLLCGTAPCCHSGPGEQPLRVQVLSVGVQYVLALWVLFI